MTVPHSTRPARRPAPGLRRVALITALLLACTTVRAPASTIGDAVAVHDGRAEPQVELWIEANRPVTSAESARASAEVRAALEQALADRAAPDADTLLVVRAQGVSRTAGRRSDQRWAVAGMVVGAVVVVVAAVAAIVLGGSGGKGSRGHPAARTPGAASAPRLPRAAPGSAARPPAIPGLAARPAPSRPGAWAAPYRPAPDWAPAGPTWDVSLGFWWVIPLQGAPEAPGYSPAPLSPAPPFALDPEGSLGPEAAAPETPGPAEPPPPDQVVLPPPPPLPVEERGFFDGDTLIVEAVLVDRQSGQPLWTKTVRRKADPRDSRAVKEAVDAALAEGGWMPPAPQD